MAGFVFVKTEPDSKMIDFYRMNYEFNDYDSSTLRFMKMNSVYDPCRRIEFEGRIKTWLIGYIINNLQGESVMICIAPGHTAKADNSSSFMYQLVKDFIQAYPTVIDGADLLLRCQEIPKQAAAGSNRCEDTHRYSIIVKFDMTVNYSNLVIIILDDVWTTGCTLRVCEEKVRTVVSPKDVKLLAIGRTV